jgi:hypothetical protein
MGGSQAAKGSISMRGRESKEEKSKTAKDVRKRARGAKVLGEE